MILKRIYNFVLCLFVVLFAASRLLAQTECDRAAVLLHKGASIGDGSEGEVIAYQDAIDICPKMAEAYFNLGVIKYRQSSKDALELFKKATELKDDTRFWIALAKAKIKFDIAGDANPILEQILSKDPTHSEALFLSGIIKLKQGNKADVKEGKEDLFAALKAEPNNPVYNLNLAKVFEDESMPEEAIRYYKNALGGELHGTAATSLAVLLTRLGRLDEASQIIEEAIKTLGPDAPPSLQQMLGVLRYKAGDFVGAEAIFVVLTKQSKVADSVKLNLGLTEAKLGKYDLAVLTLSGIVANSALSPKALRGLAWIDYLRGNMHGAKAKLLNLIQDSSADAALHNNLAIVLAKLGEHGASLDEFSKAAALDPELTPDSYERR